MSSPDTRSRPPFRADHVGSLLRPPELAEARAAHKAGRLADDALREVEDRCIARASSGCCSSERAVSASGTIIGA